MIKNVIFDVGFVLVDFRWRKLMEDLGIAKDLQDVFEKNVFGSHWWGELDRGVIEEAEVLKMLREDNKEHLKEFDYVWANRDKIVEPFDYAVGMIEDLKAKGLKVYLLSNYPKELFTLHTECGRFPFIDKVDGKVVSGFVQLVKPDREIYEYLLKEYDLKAEECVFIDDRQENVEAAKEIGINGIWFWNYEQAWEELEKIISF
ncbi:MAG: HAD family phosphatase [Lachnospiraceae bacterium]|nr:HAD family phosphatase [Lachnospiraceae bacterium]